MTPTRLVKLLIFFGLLSVNLAFSAISLAIGLPAFTENQAMPSLAPMLERSMPAVVNISTSTKIQAAENPLLQDPYFRHFFNVPRQQSRPQQQQNSLGSGVIIDSDQGYVLTNNHVIDKADKIKVTLTDGRQLDAELIGTDPEADVAIIRIPANNLTELPIADSSQLKVGDFVVAIGNPFGLGQTVTSGIVSALGRSGLGIEGYEDFIQTDASINPGNSGGALVNLRGEFIGMNTAILAPSGGNVGIGFAIPSNMVMTIKESLVKHGKVQRGLLGVTTQDLTPELVKAFNLKEMQGAAISRIENNSPAEKAGLALGDIVVSANGKGIKNSHDLRNIIGLLQVGDKVSIEYYRGEDKKETTAVIGKQEHPQLAGEKVHTKLAGTILSNTDKDQVEGILIEKINTASYAWRVGLRPGDVIVSANQFRVRNIEEFKQAAEANSGLLLNIQRGQEAFFAMLN
ncbi:MAG: DegQ family serine endoprotease [Methyloglobulus sp.]|nr:DegQ family serine endoprotease [Methyloglobulus sp.]